MRVNALILAGLLIATSALAQTEETDFLKNYDQAPAAEKLFIEHVLMGILAGLNEVNIYNHDTDNGQKTFCAPSNLSLNSDRIITILRVEVIKHPEYRLYPATRLMHKALIGFFPC